MKDAFGRRIQKKPVMENTVQKLRALSTEELEKLKERRELLTFLGLKTGRFHGRAKGGQSNLARATQYLIAAGKREIRGTQIEDILKEIVAGRLKEVRSKHGGFAYSRILNILEIAGIANRETGEIDIGAVKKCLKENRILHKGEW
jgi:hypothetical protein